MTNELEKQFFETFGIEKTRFNINRITMDSFHREKFGLLDCLDYPIITDTHYLELMCIFSDYIDTTKKDIQELKNYILEEFITNQAGFSDEELIKIQALFKEQ